MTEGIVNIHGKQYRTVALRVQDFREKYPTWTIGTDLVHRDDTVVVMKATIADEEGRVIGTGYSEEVRASSNINRTSALENAETSAIGRALAAAGFAGTEYASADEVANAIGQQEAREHIEYMHLVLEHWDAITEAKGYLANDEIEQAVAVFNELPQEVKHGLWKSYSAGGVFKTEEYQKFKGRKAKGTRNG